MKTHYILPLLLSVGTTIISSQAIASGLTYDPCENYYHENYGIDFNTTTSSAPDTKEEISSNDPNADYYKTYYSIDIQDLSDNSNPAELKVVASVSNQDMANPLNFYNW